MPLRDELFAGSIVALVTPMTSNGEVDYPQIKKLVEHHIKAGTNAIVAVGTTGESATLSIEENVKTIQKIVEFADGRIPVIAGTGSNATSEAIAMTRLLSNTNVAACLTVTPYYNKPTQEGLYQHFKAIAECTNIPQILYNVPGRTGCDLLPETVARLANVKNIVGIKEATGDVTRITKIRELVKKDFLIFSGEDITGFESIQKGGDGVISVTANIAAKAMAEMCRLALNQEYEKASQINDILIPSHKALFVESNPIPVKWACYKLGLIDTLDLRLPLTVLSKEHQSTVTDAINKITIK